MSKFALFSIITSTLICGVLLVFSLTDHATRSVTFDGRAFDVPEAYLRQGGSFSDTGFLLRFYYPQLRPLSTLSRTEINNALKAERTGQALIQSSTFRNGFDISRIRPSDQYVLPSNPLHNMKHEIWIPGDLKVLSRKLVYYPTESDKNNEFIICSDNKAPYPSCSYFFKHDELFFEVDFSRRRELKNYQRIRKDVEALVKTFEVGHHGVDAK